MQTTGVSATHNELSACIELCCRRSSVDLRMVFVDEQLRILAVYEALEESPVVKKNTNSSVSFNKKQCSVMRKGIYIGDFSG